MITGLVLADGAPEGVAVTLGALVPGVVDGLLGDAVIVARQADAALTAIAEIAGAKLVIATDGDPWRAAAPLARREWLLCLRGGDVPGEGWMRAVDCFLATASRNGQPLGRLSRRKAGLASALMNAAERVAGTGTVRAGDLVRRDWITARDAPRVRPVRIGAAVERDLAAK